MLWVCRKCYIFNSNHNNFCIDVLNYFDNKNRKLFFDLSLLIFLSQWVLSKFGQLISSLLNSPFCFSCEFLLALKGLWFWDILFQQPSINSKAFYIIVANSTNPDTLLNILLFSLKIHFTFDLTFPFALKYLLLMFLNFIFCQPTQT